MDRINEPTIYPIARDPRMYTMKEPFIAIYVAKPKQGKSVAIKYLVHRMCLADTVSHGWVYTGTAFNKDYEYLPANCVSDKFDLDHLKKVMEFQKKRPNDTPGFIVFDDIVAQVPWSNPLIAELFMNYRHYNLRLIVASQYFKKMKPEIREQTTFYIIFGRQADLGLAAVASGAFAGKKVTEVANILRANCKDYVHLISDLESEDDGADYLRFKVPIVKDMKISAFWTFKNRPKEVHCGAATKPTIKVIADTRYDNVDADTDAEGNADTEGNDRASTATNAGSIRPGKVRDLTNVSRTFMDRYGGQPTRDDYIDSVNGVRVMVTRMKHR